MTFRMCYFSCCLLFPRRCHVFSRHSGFPDSGLSTHPPSRRDSCQLTVFSCQKTTTLFQWLFAVSVFVLLLTDNGSLTTVVLGFRSLYSCGAVPVLHGI